MSWFKNIFGNTTGKSTNRPEKYSLQHLQHLYRALAKMQPIKPQSRRDAVEILRAISEVIIYGDQRQSNNIFDYFCEKNMLFLFTQMLHTKDGCGSAVSRQIIQTVSILVQNISNPTYLFYLLSNNHVNEIILHNFDFRDEDILAQYASFLKMLSLLLDENTIQFLFDGRQASFPLYTESIKLLDSTEGMVRTHSRVLALNVYRMSDDAMAQFILSPAHRGVFGKLVRFVRGRCVELGDRLRGKGNDGGTTTNNNNNKGSSSHSSSKPRKQITTVDQIKSEVNDLIDEFYFFQDVLESGKHGISDALSDALLIHLVYPLLIPALSGVTNVATNEPQSNQQQQQQRSTHQNVLESSPNRLMKRVSSHAHDISTPDGGVGTQVGTLLSLFMLTQILHSMTHTNIINAISICCLSLGNNDGSSKRQEEDEEEKEKEENASDNQGSDGNENRGGEPNLSKFIVGFKDPMVKNEQSEISKGEASSLSSSSSSSSVTHNYLSPERMEEMRNNANNNQKNDTNTNKNTNTNTNTNTNINTNTNATNATPPTAEDSDDTDYENDEEDDDDDYGQVMDVMDTTRTKRKSNRQRTSSLDSIGYGSDRTFPTSSNIHRLRVLACLVSTDERLVLMTILLLRSIIDQMENSFLCNVGMLPASRVDENVKGSGDHAKDNRERSPSSNSRRRRTWSSEHDGRSDSVTSEDISTIMNESETKGEEKKDKEEKDEKEEISLQVVIEDEEEKETDDTYNRKNVMTTMGKGTIISIRQEDGVKIVELEWKLANQSKAIMYTTQTIDVQDIQNVTTTPAGTQEKKQDYNEESYSTPTKPTKSTKSTIPSISSTTSSIPASLPTTATAPIPTATATTLPVPLSTFQSYRYPTVLVEALLSVLVREAIAPLTCRILTFRTVSQFILELVSNDASVPKGVPLLHSFHLSILACAVSRCSKALRHFLSESKFLERTNHRFIEIFETEQRIVFNNQKIENQIPLETIASRSELLLEVAKGPTTGGGRSTSMDDRHPYGDVESVRQLVRVSLLLRWLESKLGGVTEPVELIDQTNGGNNGDVDLEKEGDLVDLSQRKHVQCRQRTLKNNVYVDRPVFLIITPLVMSIAEIFVSKKDPPGTPRSKINNSQNHVKHTSIVPVHLIDAIVDTTDNKTLHLTVFSHNPPKMFQRLGSNNIGSSGVNGSGKNAALSCWRLTVNFANPGACSWTKATIEKHRAELRREKLGTICSMMGVGDCFSESAL